jgi:hypothetical protein
MLGEAQCHNDATCVGCFGVFQSQTETATNVFDASDHDAFEIRDGLARKPLAIPDELLQRLLRLRRWQGMLMGKDVERKFASGMRDVTRVPG